MNRVARLPYLFVYLGGLLYFCLPICAAAYYGIEFSILWRDLCVFPCSCTFPAIGLRFYLWRPLRITIIPIVAGLPLIRVLL